MRRDFRLGRPERRKRGTSHQHRHEEVGIAPAKPLIRQDQGQSAGNQHRKPIAEHRQGCPRPPLILVQHVGAIGIEGNILRGRAKCHQDGNQGKRQQGRSGRQCAHRRDAQCEQHLRQQHPATPATKPGWRETIDEGRPDELERVGGSNERQEPDILQTHLFDSRPGLQSAAGERQRQSAREAEHQQGRDATPCVKRKRRDRLHLRTARRFRGYLTARRILAPCAQGLSRRRHARGEPVEARFAGKVNR